MLCWPMFVAGFLMGMGLTVILWALSKEEE